VKKRESTVTKTASVIKKLNLCKERVRVLTSADLKLVAGATSGIETWSCVTQCHEQ
jgi:hypothetical protein